MKRLAIVAVLSLAMAIQSNAQHVSVRLNFPVGVSVRSHGARPYSNAVWVGPEWQWRGNQYQSVPGYWAKPPRNRAVWVSGYWQRARGGYRWVPGHWSSVGNRGNRRY
jgi:hypothetical protein